jgi:hypothetical protein
LIGYAWSTDGSVIGVYGAVGKPTGKTLNSTFVKQFLDAYDFRSHQMVNAGSKLQARSKAIVSLMNARGGKNDVVLVSSGTVNKALSGRDVQGYDLKSIERNMNYD